MSGLKGRLAAAAGALLVAGTVGTLVLPSADAATSSSDYLVGQLTDGNHLTNSYGVDYGLTADLAIALAASNDQDPALGRVVGYLAAHVADYADPAGTGQYPGPYGGALGKLALVAESTGQDPTSFGGFDLLTTLTGHVCTAADSSGACTAAGDFYQSYSTISQSLAVLALARDGQTPPAATVSRLEELQCSDGGFSSELIAAGAPCTSDVDTTSYAAQALALLPGTGTQVGKARDFLLAAQQGDGGFLGAAGENANSTGLAGQALQAVGIGSASGDPIGAAKTFLVGLRTSGGGFAINSSTPGADVRSTTQAVPMLAGAVLATVSDPVTAVTPTTTPTSTTPSTPASSAPASTPSHRPTPSTAASSAVAPQPTGTLSVAAVDAGSQLANTGSRTRVPLVLAVLLVALGAGALAVARRAGQRR